MSEILLINIFFIFFRVRIPQRATVPLATVAVVETLHDKESQAEMELHCRNS